MNIVIPTVVQNQFNLTAFVQRHDELSQIEIQHLKNDPWLKNVMKQVYTDVCDSNKNQVRLQLTNDDNRTTVIHTLSFSKFAEALGKWSYSNFKTYSTRQKTTTEILAKYLQTNRFGFISEDNEKSRWKLQQLYELIFGTEQQTQTNRVGSNINITQEFAKLSKFKLAILSSDRGLKKIVTYLRENNFSQESVNSVWAIINSKNEYPPDFFSAEDNALFYNTRRILLELLKDFKLPNNRSELYSGSLDQANFSTALIEQLKKFCQLLSELAEKKPDIDQNSILGIAKRYDKYKSELLSNPESVKRILSYLRAVNLNQRTELEITNICNYMVDNRGYIPNNTGWFQEGLLTLADKEILGKILGHSYIDFNDYYIGRLDPSKLRNKLLKLKALIHGNVRIRKGRGASNSSGNNFNQNRHYELTPEERKLTRKFSLNINKLIINDGKNIEKSFLKKFYQLQQDKGLINYLNYVLQQADLQQKNSLKDNNDAYITYLTDWQSGTIPPWHTYNFFYRNKLIILNENKKILKELFQDALTRENMIPMFKQLHSLLNQNISEVISSSEYASIKMIGMVEISCKGYNVADSEFTELLCSINKSKLATNNWLATVWNRIDKKTPYQAAKLCDYLYQGNVPVFLDQQNMFLAYDEDFHKDFKQLVDSLTRNHPQVTMNAYTYAYFKQSIIQGMVNYINNNSHTALRGRAKMLEEEFEKNYQEINKNPSLFPLEKQAQLASLLAKYTEEREGIMSKLFEMVGLSSELVVK